MHNPAPRFLWMFARRVTRFNAQDGLCCWCLEPMDHPLPIQQQSLGPLFASWEHLTPISKGGSRGWRNIALSHLECNQRRGSDMSWTPTVPEPPVSAPKVGRRLFLNKKPLLEVLADARKNREASLELIETMGRVSFNGESP
jgi:hypothetical protein